MLSSIVLYRAVCICRRLCVCARFASLVQAYAFFFGAGVIGLIYVLLTVH